MIERRRQQNERNINDPFESYMERFFPNGLQSQFQISNTKRKLNTLVLETFSLDVKLMFRLENSELAQLSPLRSLKALTVLCDVFLW